MLNLPFCLLLGLVLLVPGVRAADRLPIIIGGELGSPWRNGGGAIPALVKTSEEVVEETNTPGGVLDLEVNEFPNWVFPQKIDSTRSILIGLTGEGRGGSVYTPTLSFRAFEPDFPMMFDDDGTTAFAMRAPRPGESAGGRGLLIQFDLGAVFSVNRIKFFPRNADPDYPAPTTPFQKDFIKGYELLTNDGSPETIHNGILEFPRLVIEEQNERSVVDHKFPPRFVRHIRFKSLSDVDFEIAEFQVFSLGFVPQAAYVSNVFDFSEPALLGNLRWVEHQFGDPRRSRVRLRTRTGLDRQPLKFTRVGVQGTGKTRTRLLVLGSFEEEIPIDAVWKKAEDLEDAPPLSQPVEFLGLTVTTPSALVERILDNGEFAGQEVLLLYDRLPAGDRDLLAIDREAYFGLDEGERTGISDDLVNWSPWSPPYSEEGIVDLAELEDQDSGTALTSPDGRRYFQFMLEFESDAFDAATGVGSIAFDVGTPGLADSLVGEIAPREAALGRETEFTYAVLVETGSGEGFDRLEIATPVRTSAVELVEILEPDGGRLEADFSGADLDHMPQSVNGVALEEVSDRRLAISFPPVDGDGSLIKVRFRNAVLRYGTRFDGKALSGANRIGQRVIAGNAADLGEEGIQDPDRVSIGSPNPGNLSVSVPISEHLLVNVDAVPAVFSPNGDGVNDVVSIGYDVTNIGRETTVRIGIYDLGGRLVRSYDDPRTSGRFARHWNGRGSSNELVPPGNYIIRVSIDARSDEFAETGLVAVVY